MGETDSSDCLREMAAMCARETIVATTEKDNDYPLKKSVNEGYETVGFHDKGFAHLILEF